MNDNNTRKLFKRFSFLNKKTLDSVSCGDGWYSLVYNMCKELKAASPPSDFIITKISERYGELDVHSKNGVMRTRVIIDEFNTASIEICDDCGNNRDLEQCPKCTVPVIEYPELEEDEDEDEDEEEDSDAEPALCTTCYVTPCMCKCGTCSTNPCGCP